MSPVLKPLPKLNAAQIRSLVARYLPRIQRIARGMARNLPRSVDVEDLVQAGALGVLGALRSFDPRRAGVLDAHVIRRARGAMLDELRALDPLTRDQRREARAVERATRAVEGESCRPAEEREVAARAGMSVERVRSVRGTVARSVSVPLDVVGEPGFHDDPAVRIDAEARAARLRAAVASLGEREREILDLYYVRDQSLREIGERFGITESRVCQIHGATVARLRGLLAEDAA